MDEKHGDYSRSSSAAAGVEMLKLPGVPSVTSLSSAASSPSAPATPVSAEHTKSLHNDPYNRYLMLKYSKNRHDNDRAKKAFEEALKEGSDSANRDKAAKRLEENKENIESKKRTRFARVHALAHNAESKNQLDAQLYLAALYEEGDGVEANMHEAQELIRKRDERMWQEKNRDNDESTLNLSFKSR